MPLTPCRTLNRRVQNHPLLKNHVFGSESMIQKVWDPYWKGIRIAIRNGRLKIRTVAICFDERFDIGYASSDVHRESASMASFRSSLQWMEGWPRTLIRGILECIQIRKMHTSFDWKGPADDRRLNGLSAGEVALGLQHVPLHHVRTEEVHACDERHPDQSP